MANKVNNSLQGLKQNEQAFVIGFRNAAFHINCLFHTMCLKAVQKSDPSFK